jgi:hypothetical protein
VKRILIVVLTGAAMAVGVGSAFAAAGATPKPKPPGHGWITKAQAGALLHAAPIFLPGYGQFYFPPNEGSCTAFGATRKDSRKRTLWRTFRCRGGIQNAAYPGTLWSVDFYTTVAPDGRSFRVTTDGVVQARCYYPVGGCP